MPSKPKRARGRTSSTAPEFNPMSFNAQFAGLHAKLNAHQTAMTLRIDAQDTLLAQIKTQTTVTNGRVTELERVHDEFVTERKVSKRWVMGLAGGISFLVTIATIAVKLLVR